MVEKEKKENAEPTVAPGMENNAGQGLDASEKDKETGNTTSVTIASWDEVDPS